MDQHEANSGQTAESTLARRDTPGSPVAALVAMAPFIVQPLPFAFMQTVPALAVLMLTTLTDPVSVRLAGNILLGVAAAYMVALTVGWVKGFPLWSYPYWVQGLLFSMYMTSAATPGLVLFNHRFQHDELWGWRSWIPLVFVAAVSLLMTRSLWPLRQLVADLLSDWTRVSFGLYAAMPLLILFAFDEIGGEEVYVLALLALMAMGAFVYTRSAKTWQRALALFASLTAVWMAATVYVAAYWHGRQEFWMREPGNGIVIARGMTISLLIILSLMFAPAAPGLLRRCTGRARPA